MTRRGAPLQGLQAGFQGYGDLAGRARQFHNDYDTQALENIDQISDSLPPGMGIQTRQNEIFNQARGRWNYGSPMDQFMQASQEAGGMKPLEFGYESNPAKDLSRSPEALEGLQRAMPFNINQYSKSNQLGTPIDPEVDRRGRSNPTRDTGPYFERGRRLR